MHRQLAATFVSAFCLVPAIAAEAPTPPFAPGAHKLKNGQPNELMVLGSPHLSQMSKSFDLAKVGLLNDRLAEWKPQAVAIESACWWSSAPPTRRTWKPTWIRCTTCASLQRTGCCAPNKTR